MQMNDMILVSVDDHVCEPPSMWDQHLSGKWKERAPKLVHKSDGSDVWVFEGQGLRRVERTYLAENASLSSEAAAHLRTLWRCSHDGSPAWAVPAIKTTVKYALANDMDLDSCGLTDRASTATDSADRQRCGTVAGARRLPNSGTPSCSLSAASPCWAAGLGRTASGNGQPSEHRQSTVDSAWRSD